jgi:pyridinium-3,5-biscarboxylic acid mononucleotide synthase
MSHGGDHMHDRDHADDHTHGRNHGGSASIRRLLEALLEGDLGLEDALQKLRLLQVTQLGEFARLDVNRDLRKGVPEVVYAPRKTDADLEAIARRFLADRGLVLVSRLEPERAERLRRALVEEAAEALTFVYDPAARVLAARTPAYRPPESGGCVGLLTAGTSDIPVAEEAALVITHMGCRVERGYDTGVAGVHRLLEPLTRMIESGADALVVVAGMEGALPSVVAGLVDVPVIGVPTSTGYGLGGDGTAALYSILQSCSPGLVAVNIDNGVGAGAAAALIARRRVT